MIPRGLPILIAEDDEDEALLLAHALKAIGVSNPVLMVDNGEHVIAYLKGEGQFADRETFPLPAVLITDLKMPAVGGFELLEWLRRNPRFAIIPTLVFSNSSEPQDIQRAYALGANAYLVKPPGMEQLEAMMRTTFDFWMLCAHTPLLAASRQREAPSDVGLAAR